MNNKHGRLASYLLVGLAICGWSLLAACSITQPDHTHTGLAAQPAPPIPAYEVFLPTGYDTSTARYPVIYCLDGPTMVTDASAGGCNLRLRLQQLVAAGLAQPAIIVSLPAPANRTKAYVPFSDPTIPELQFGGTSATEYAMHLLTVVQQIDTRYRTQASAAQRAVFGLSFSGLFASWLPLSVPGTFGMVAALSPSYWVGDYALITAMQGLQQATLIHYFDVGTREWNYYTPLLTALQQKGLAYAQHSFYNEVRYGDHAPNSWAARIHVPLLVFLGDRRSPPVGMTVNIQVIRSATSSRLFQRINPVITLANGIQYSPNEFATFEVLDVLGGSVTPDGRFALNGAPTLQVRVRYLHFDQTITIEAARINEYLDN